VTHSPLDPALSDVQTILRAARFASVRHVQQKRKGAAGEPYFNHLIEVADLVARSLSAPDANLVAAALLHDVVEDTATAPEEVLAEFGADIAALVAEVTDDKALPRARRKELQVEHAPHISARAQAIKIADKISNVRALQFTPPEDWDETRKREYYEWASRVVEACSAPHAFLKSEFARALPGAGA